ncbi:MAG: hypothetical protein K2Y23_11260 [Cyanobacteria bacterium]|nr:hypothetical protein [Cyanobacteriota bacterium]
MRLLALLLATALQSAAPDFSGTWTMVPDRSGSPQQSEPITMMTFVITQAGDVIRIESTSGNNKPILATYPFGPVPRQPAEPLSADQSRAYWQGQRLIVERGGTINGQTVSAKQTLSLNPDRSELTVERLVIVQHGYTLKGTPNYATVTDVFVRAR